MRSIDEKLQERILVVYMIENGLDGNKNRTNRNNSNLSCLVALPVQFSNSFLRDLGRLIGLGTY